MVDDKKEKKKKPPKLTIDDFKHVKLDPSWSPLQRLVRMSQEAEKLLKQEKRVNESERPMITEKQEGTSTEKPPVSGGSGVDVSRAERLTTEKERERLTMGQKMSSLEVSRLERLTRERALKKPVECEPHISKREKKLMMMMMGEEEEEGYFKKRASCGIDISKGERSRGEKHSLKKPVSCGIDERLMMRGKTLKIKPLAYPVDTKRSEKPLNRKRPYSPDSDDYEVEAKAVKKKTKKNNVRPDYMGPEPPPGLPQEVLDRIQRENGSDVKLVIQKSIYGTDLSSGHNRLQMPLSQVRGEFLNEGEVALLGTHNGKKMNGIDALLLEPRGGRKCGITFKKWTLKKPDGKKPSETYVFNGQWKYVCLRNRLKEGMIVQVWSFRRENGSLGFTLVIVEEGGGGSSGGGGGAGDDGGVGGRGTDGDGDGDGGGSGGGGDDSGGGKDYRTSESQSGDEKGGSGSDSDAKKD